MSLDVWYEIILREMAEQDRMRELLRDAEEATNRDEERQEATKPS
jgi:hypothetical protein